MQTTAYGETSDGTFFRSLSIKLEYGIACLWFYTIVGGFLFYTIYDRPSAV